MGNYLTVEKKTSEKLGDTLCLARSRIIFMSCQLNTISNLDILYPRFYSYKAGGQFQDVFGLEAIVKNVLKMHFMDCRITNK